MPICKAKHPENRRGGKCSLAYRPVFERQKNSRGGALKYNFLCFTIPATCLCTIIHQRKSGRQSERTHKRQSCFRIKLFSSYLDQRPALTHTHTAVVLNRVAVRQQRLGHKEAQTILETRPEWVIHIGRGSDSRP